MYGGPYFFNSAGLYLKGWVERFNPDKEYLSCAPAWIRLYSLPWEYWEENSLQEIGNALGEFIKVAEETKLCRYTSYARICVYMDLKQALPDTVSLFHEDVEWIQLIDYEHVPFRCRKCHNLGHLYRDYPLNKKTPSQMTSDNQELDGFTKVVNHRRGNKKSTVHPKIDQVNMSKPSTSNSFETLASNDMQDPNNGPLKDKESNKEQLEGTSQQPGDNLLRKSTPQSQTKTQAWQTQGMEVDNPEPSAKTLKESEEASQEP